MDDMRAVVENMKNDEGVELNVKTTHDAARTELQNAQR